MKTLSHYITRSNALRAIVLIACINLCLSITYPIYALFIASCSLIVLVGLNTKKIYGIYYFLHTDKYRIAFVTPKVWRSPPYNYKPKKWFFHYLTKQHPYLTIKIRQLYIFGFGFGIKINLYKQCAINNLPNIQEIKE